MWFLVALAGLAAAMEFDGIAVDGGSGPDDPWLAGNPDEDEFISTDEPGEDEPDDDEPPPDDPPPPPPNEDQAWLDPWLNGWSDDEYLSTDQPDALA